MLVRARGLAKCYRGAAGHPVRALEAVDLDAAPGELVAVVGASGSGKSTLLNLLGLLEPPDAGEIWFDDVRVSHLSRRAQARVRGTRIGYVFQSFLLVSSLTAHRQRAARRALRRARPRDGAARGAGPDGAPRRGGPARTTIPPQLSGGEQQRVAYCRAVLNGPPLVLADEPTGSLDEAHARVILGELRGLVRERGTSVILVTHRAEAAAEADRALRLEAGRLEPT